MGFLPPVAQVYNPLEYARLPHEAYLRRYGSKPIRVLFVGMNPGPFGMAQTGVPFGDVTMVRDWLKISGTVEPPPTTHPKRPVAGFRCTRREVSGMRLWGWARETFGTPERFFSECFVINYCPLVFMDTSGKNITPDQLRADERGPLFGVCDAAVRRVVSALAPQTAVGIGRFAAERLRLSLGDERCAIATLLHPSPANPRASRDFAPEATACLRACGVVTSKPGAELGRLG